MAERAQESVSSIELHLEDGQDAIRMTTMGTFDAESGKAVQGVPTTSTVAKIDEPQVQSGDGRDADSISVAHGASSQRSLLRIDSMAMQDADVHNAAAVSSLPPVDRGVKAWTFLFIATSLEMLIWGAGNAYGTFADYHLYNEQSPLHGQSTSAITAPGVLITAGQYSAPFLFLGLLNAFPRRIRLFSIVTLVVSACSLLIASFIPTTVGVIVFQGFFAGFAGGAFYTPAIVYLPQWFDEKRGLATGILFLGSGLGGVCWPFIFSALLQDVGFEWTLRALCVTQLVCGSLIVCFLRPRLPVGNGVPATPASAKSARSDDTAASANVGSRHNPVRRRRNLLRAVMPSHNKVVHTPIGLTYSSLLFIQNAAFWSVSYYIAPFASSLGFGGTFSTALLAAFNAASAVSYVATGKLCDVMPHILLVLLAASTGSLLVGLLLGFARSIAPLTVFTILYGLLNGGFSCTMSPMAREMAKAGSNEHSSVFLEFLAIRGLGGVVGPLIASALYGASQTGSSAVADDGGIWGNDAVYGSHRMGPLVIFVTVLQAVVAVMALGSIPLRKSALRSQ